jgi:hypothetical protein
MAMDFINLKMEINIRDIEPMMLGRVKGFSHGKTDKFMMANGRMIKCMEKEVFSSNWMGD